MVVYVDDILIFSPSSDLVKEVMLKVQDKFKCKALGDVSFYLWLHIERDVEKRCMQVHQRKYLEALSANFGQSEGHVATPFPSGLKSVKGPEEESVGGGEAPFSLIGWKPHVPAAQPGPSLEGAHSAPVLPATAPSLSPAIESAVTLAPHPEPYPSVPAQRGADPAPLVAEPVVAAAVSDLSVGPCHAA
ncbi:unnamed protein product [Closterium sp. NIES-53]